MLLLDTHLLLELVAEPKKLPKIFYDQINKNIGKIFISAISAYDIGIKHNKKLIELPLHPDEWLQKVLQFHGITEIPITSKIATTATQLPQLHDNFVDRIIIATAIDQKLTILTLNKFIKQYPAISCVPK